MFDEREFISWATAGADTGDLRVGPGDDAAVLADGTVVALDTFVETVHFDPGTPLDAVARKAIGACLSDLCAMGAVGEAVFVSAQLTPGCDGRTLARALAGFARQFGVVLAGGDTVRTPPGSLALSVTAVGRCAGEPWLRSGGRPDDRLVVTGPLGGSRGGRHLDVRPRTDVVERARAAALPVSACLDLSDGLGVDLARLCAASGTGAEVVAEALPVHDDVAPGRDPIDAVLGDGEDFELLLALPPEVAVPDDWTVIGTLRPQGPLVLARHGARTPWPETGHVHGF